MIEFNCDMGEGQANDAAFMPYVDRVNISCGGHAGTKVQISKTIQAAIEHKLLIGAHPSYPDRENFGRKSITMTTEAFTNSIRAQLAYFNELLRSSGGELTHIKAHGALYNDLANQQELAEVFCNTVAGFSSRLTLIVPAASQFFTLATEAGFDCLQEAFLDRRYEDDLSLSNRAVTGAVITDQDQALAQLKQLLQTQKVTTTSGNIKPLKADTICIHSDSPNALELVKAAHEAKQSW